MEIPLILMAREWFLDLHGHLHHIRTTITVDHLENLDMNDMGVQIMAGITTTMLVPEKATEAVSVVAGEVMGGEMTVTTLSETETGALHANPDEVDLEVLQVDTEVGET